MLKIQSFVSSCFFYSYFAILLLLLLLLLAWNNDDQNLVLVVGFSPDSSSSSTALEGYFRFLDSSGSNDSYGDDDNDDPDDDDDKQPHHHDEEFSFIPDFVHHFYTIGFPKISTDPYVEKDYYEKSFDIVVNAAKTESLKREVIELEAEKDADAQVTTALIVESNKTSGGAQLWGSVLTSKGQFSGLFPHYMGKSRIQLCLITANPTRIWDNQKQKIAGQTLFGTVCCTFDPDGNALKFLQSDDETKTIGGIRLGQSCAIIPDKGVLTLGMGFMIPENRECYNVFHFHCHNLAFFFKKDNCRDRNPPLKVMAQLSGFADKEVFCYDTLEEFEIWSKELNRQREDLPSGKKKNKNRRKEIHKDDTRFSSQFFGTNPNKKDFRNKNEDEHALIFGHVIETDIKTNDVTGETFVWALIRTAGMEIDVVFRQSLLESQGSPLPKVGGVLRGHFWLSGILMLDGANEYM